MNESLIGLLNRHFVSTYYNTFSGPGYDADAAAFAKAVTGGPLRYGAIVTTEGKVLRAFGFEEQDVFQSFRDVLRAHPELFPMTSDERSAFDRAREEPLNLEAQLTAAHLWAERLEFEKGRALLSKVLEAEHLSATERARVAEVRAHLAVIDPLRKEKTDIARELESIRGGDTELMAAVMADRAALVVEKSPEGAFFTGSRLKPGADGKLWLRRLEEWLTRAPRSPRRGELMFYLGVVKNSLGDRKGADEVWRRHFETMPNDRFALTSRLHESGYPFSPRGPNIILSGRLSDPKLMRRIRDALRRGKVQGVSGSGKPLTEEQIEKLIDDAMKNRKHPQSTPRPKQEWF